MTKATPDNDLGGYDYHFVDLPPDTLVCKICHCPSKEPHLSVCCGHTFCKSCLTSAKNIADVCPMCRNTNFNTFPNKQNERLIKSLDVFCTNKDKGCEWKGEVNDIKIHLDGCQFEEVRCSNNCSLSVQRQHLSNHTKNECPRRLVNCEYCRTTGEHQFIDNQHKNECSKFPVPCPNKCDMTIRREDINEHVKHSCPYQMLKCSNLCGALFQRKDQSTHISKCPRRRVYCPCCSTVLEYCMVKQHYQVCPKFPLPCPNKCNENSIPREDINKHRKDCPLEVVSCSNSCGKNIQRQDLTDHVENQCPHRKISCQLCDTIGEYQFIEHQHKDQCPKFPLVCPNKCNATILRKNMKAHRKVCPLEIIQCEFHGVGCETTLVRRDWKKHYQDKVMEHLLFTNSELLSTKSELANVKKKLAAVEKNTDAALAKMEAKFQRKINEIDAAARKKTRDLESQLQQSNWFKKLHSRSAASLSGKNSLPVTIKMTGYSRKKRNNEVWTSTSFYTSDLKYKLQLIVRPGSSSTTYGDHESYMAVQLDVTRVDGSSRSCYTSHYYDDYETTIYHHDDYTTRRIEVQVLNQTSDNEHFTETQEAFDWDSDEYISTGLLHRKTATCQYLKNDTVFFAVYQK